MWSCLLLTDAESDPVVFSGVAVVPAGDPIALVDAVNRAGTEHCLIVAPPALAAALHLGVTIVAGRRPELMISSMITEHAPLAILSALALARAATDEPAIGVELTRRLLANSWSGAWTASVAKLDSPNPSLGQHLRSLLPGSGFLLRQAPEPAVLGQPHPDDVPPAGRDRVLLVQDDGVPTPIAERLAAAEGVTAVRQVALPGDWLSVYGTDRVGQLALMPADPHTLINAPTHRCPACRLELITGVCPFCHVVADELVAVVAISSSAPTPAAGLLKLVTPMSASPPDDPGSGRQPRTHRLAPPAPPARPAPSARPAQPGGPA